MKNLEKKLEEEKQEKPSVSLKGKAKEKYAIRKDPANKLTGVYKAGERKSWPVGEYDTSFDKEKGLAKACATVAKYVAEKRPKTLQDESTKYTILNENGEVVFEGNYNDLLKKSNVEGLEDYAEVPVKIVEKYGDIVVSRKKITERRDKRMAKFLEQYTE
jgi:hypothetical protein